MSPKKTSGARLIADAFRKKAFSAVPDLKVPSEISKSLIQIRSTAVESISKEVSKVINKIDITKLLNQILKEYTIRLEAKIEFQPKPKKGSR